MVGGPCPVHPMLRPNGRGPRMHRRIAYEGVMRFTFGDDAEHGNGYEELPVKEAERIIGLSKHPQLLPQKIPAQSTWTGMKVTLGRPQPPRERHAKPSQTS